MPIRASSTHVVIHTDALYETNWKEAELDTIRRISQELGIPEHLYTIGETMQEPQASPQSVYSVLHRNAIDSEAPEWSSDRLRADAQAAIIDAIEHRASDVLLEGLQASQGHMIITQDGDMRPAIRRPDGVILIDDVMESKLRFEDMQQEAKHRFEQFKQSYISSPNGDIDLDAKPVPKPQTPLQPIKIKIVASEKDFDMSVVDARTGALIDNVVSVDLHIKFQGGMPRAEALLRVHMPELDIVASGSLTEQDVLDDV